MPLNGRVFIMRIPYKIKKQKHKTQWQDNTQFCCMASFGMMSQRHNYQSHLTETQQVQWNKNSCWICSQEDKGGKVLLYVGVAVV